MEKDKCHICGEPIKGKWDSQVELGLETGELKEGGMHRWLIYDKHIKCSPSRAQRIVHPQYPKIVDDREVFDIRLWDEEKRSKWISIYTSAWVRLQEKYNPTWACQK